MEVAEELFNSDEYKELLKGDPSLPTWTQFKEIVSGSETFAEKFARWIIEGGEDFETFENIISQAKELKIPLENPNNLSFSKYLGNLNRKIQNLSGKEKNEIVKTYIPSNIEKTHLPDQKITSIYKGEDKSEDKEIEEIKQKIDQKLDLNININHHKFSPESVKKLKNWFIECEKLQEINQYNLKGLPDNRIYKLGGVSEEDIKNHNCEADYLWAYKIAFIDLLDAGLKPIIKSGSASGTGDPFKTIEKTSRREGIGTKVILAVFYAPRKKKSDGTPDTSDLDKKYHPIMRQNLDWYFYPVAEKGKKGGAGTEMFYIDFNPNIDEIKARAIEEVLQIDKTKRTKTLNPNTQQQKPLKDIKEKIERLKEAGKALTIFLGYKCRFPGKTIATLLAFSKLPSKFILVFSRRKNIAESWERNSQYFSNIEYISLLDFIKLSSIDESKKYLIVGTVQSLEKRGEEDEGEENDVPEEFKENEEGNTSNDDGVIPNEKLDDYFNSFLKIIGNNKFWIALDEAHQGGIAEQTSKILKTFSENPKCETRWDISGTGLKLFKENDYDLEYHYDIINEEKDRSEYLKKFDLKYKNDPLPFLPIDQKNWIKKISEIDFQKDPDARVLKSPKKLTFVIDHSIISPKELKKIKQIGNNEGIPLMKHLLSRDEHGARFPFSVDNTVDWILGEGDYKRAQSEKFNQGFIKESNKSYFKDWGFLCFTSMVKGGKTLQESFERYSDIEVINICGRYLSQEEINITIRSSIMQNKKPIIISCGSHGEGSDFDQIIATFHLDNGTSGENKTQRGFRGATPFMGKTKPDGPEIFKSIHFDVYFDMSQALKIAADEIIKIQKDSNKGLEETIIQYRQACPLYSVGLKINEVDSLKYPEKIKEEIDFQRIKNSIININFDISKIPDNFWTSINKVLLKDLPNLISLGKKEKHSGGDKHPRGESDEKSKDSKEKKEKEKKEFEIFIDNLINSLDSFTTRPYFTLNSFTSMEDLFNNLSEKSFYNNLGISKDNYRFLIKEDAFKLNELDYFLSTRPRLINLENFKNREIGEAVDLSLQEIKLGKDPYRMFIGTPKEIVDEIEEKLYFKLQKSQENKNLKIIDLELKNGEFPLISIKILDKLLSSSIKNDSERIQWILDNNIYGFSMEETNIDGFILLLKKLILGNKDINLTKLKEHIQHINNIEELSEKLNNMKKSGLIFDVIIGNPPFQGESFTENKGASQASTALWPKFVKLSFQNSNNYVCLITPRTVIKTPSFSQNLKSLSILNLNSEKIAPYFQDIGSSFCYFLFSLKDPPKEKTIIFSDGNEEKVEDLSFLKNISGGGTITKKGIEIIEKISNKIKKNIPYKKGTAISINSDFYSIDKNEKYPYKCYYSSKKDRQNLFTKEKTEGYGAENKLIVAHIFDFGNQSNYEHYTSSDKFTGAGLQAGVLYFSDKVDLENIKQYLFSDICRFIDHFYRHGRYAYDVFRNIPYIDLSRSWSNDELYEYFNLEEYKEYIQSQI